MALIMARVDLDTICLVGRLLRSTMLLYLQTTAKSFAEGLAVEMF